MNRNSKWLVVVGIAAAVLFMMVWDFTPRASTKGKKQDERVTPPDVTPSVTYRSPTERHKVQVSDPELARQIKEQGGRIVADYESFQVFEVNSALESSLAANRGAELRDEDNVIALNAGAIDTTRPEVQAMRASVAAFAGKRMHLVQFPGPVRPEWHAALAKTGVEIVTYIPNNAFLVYSNAKTLQRVQALGSLLQWEGAYTNSMRLAPGIEQAAAAGKEEATKEGAALTAKPKSARSTSSKYRSRTPADTDHDLYAIQMVKDKIENANTMALIDRVRTEEITNQWEVLNYLDVVVHIPAAALVSQIARRPDVVSIAPYSTPVKMDERQNFIIAGQVSGTPAVPPAVNPGWLVYLASQGFTQAQFDASNFAVNISDSGLDNATTTPNHFGLYRSGDPNLASRVIYNRLEGTPNGGSTLAGKDGHGTLNSHIIMG